MNRKPIEHSVLLGSFLFLLVGCGVDSSEVAELPEVVDFNLHIKPLLSDRCFKCHGPDKNQQKAGLALHEEELAFSELAENKGHYAIIPGDPQKSIIYQRITSNDPTALMPPPSSNLSLNDYEIALIKRWIQQGAKWKKHWAFIPPQALDIPEASKTDWPINPIDHFILEKLDAEGQAPNQPAKKTAWLRRVHFDLTGLPPTPHEIQGFLANESPNAYEEKVDELLDTPAFGERMASDWLDVARYADSHGYQDDRPRTMWPWRDWVIEAFNQNMPYDQFVTWQVAGDLLPNATYKQKLATGFNRNHPITQEGGVINEEYLTEYAADRTQTFATAFLSLTMECARCHDHKYDPISQEDYYSLFSFFNNVKQERGKISYYDQSPVPNMQVVDPELDEQIEAVKAKIAELEGRENQIIQTEKASFEAWKKDWTTEDLTNDLEQGMIARCDFEALPVVNHAQPAIETGININLPPEIDLPVLTDGHSGQGMAFNGANFLTLGDIGDFDHYDAFSLSGWIRHSGDHTKMATIFGRRNGELQRQGYDLALTKDHYLQFRLRATNENQLIIKSKVKLAANAWQHITVTYDGSSRGTGVQFYVNGQMVDAETLQENVNGLSILNGNNFLVGNWNHRAVSLSDQYGFKGGAVDRVFVFDRLVSPLEAQWLASGAVNRITNKELWGHYLIHGSAQNKDLQNALKQQRRKDLSIPKVMVMEEMDTIKATYVLNRGAYDAPTTPVTRTTPASILPFPEDLPNNRLGLARWLFHADNPLTARVYVNRLWQMCFGKGLVHTTEDFGNQGALPSHPELLDWLATAFSKDWDIKKMIKLMVLSATYRQSGEMTTEKLAWDPENRYYSRGPANRLTAEMLRDQALAVSDLLHPQVGGKWVKPYQPAGIWKELANQIGENKYRQSYGENLFRRSLYTYWKRTIPPPTMITLDASERAVCTVKRQVTSTPLQALILLNDPQYVEAARVLAENVIREHKEGPKKWIAQLFKAIVSREILPEELELLMALYESEKDRFVDYPRDQQAYLAIGESPNIHSNDPQAAALAVVTSTIFNLDEAKFK